MQSSDRLPRYKKVSALALFSKLSLKNKQNKNSIKAMLRLQFHFHTPSRTSVSSQDASSQWKTAQFAQRESFIWNMSEVHQPKMIKKMFSHLLTLSFLKALCTSEWTKPQGMLQKVVMWTEAPSRLSSLVNSKPFLKKKWFRHNNRTTSTRPTGALACN